MGRVFRRGVLAALCAVWPVLGQAETITLATLEWPPYVADKLPQQGGEAAVVRAAFQAVGIDVRFEFMPWTRAIKLGTFSKDYAGYFPAYFGEERNRTALMSQPIGSSPLGIAHRKDRPLSWKTLDDLTPYKLGVVDGYVNTAEFDRRKVEGLLQVDGAPSDESNLMKLAVNRVDLAVVDRHVFDFLLRTRPALAPHKDNLVFDGPLLEDKPLYIYFRRGAEGERLRALFAVGLQKIDPAQVFRQAVGP